MFVTTSPTSVLLTTTSLYLKVEGPEHQFTDFDICWWRKVTTYLAYSHPPVGTEYHSITQRHLFCFMSSDAFFSVSPVAKFKQQIFCSETATQQKRTYNTEWKLAKETKERNESNILQTIWCKYCFMFQFMYVIDMFSDSKLTFLLSWWLNNYMHGRNSSWNIT